MRIFGDGRSLLPCSLANYELLGDTRAHRVGTQQRSKSENSHTSFSVCCSLPVVVNYDFPGNLETYVHRVGRAGRLAADGHALSFMTRNLAPLAEPLLALLQVGYRLLKGF